MALTNQEKKTIMESYYFMYKQFFGYRHAKRIIFSLVEQGYLMEIQGPVEVDSVVSWQNIIPCIYQLTEKGRDFVETEKALQVLGDRSWEKTECIRGYPRGRY
jgi:hypothetical protein